MRPGISLRAYVGIGRPALAQASTASCHIMSSRSLSVVHSLKSSPGSSSSRTLRTGQLARCRARRISSSVLATSAAYQGRAPERSAQSHNLGGRGRPKPAAFLRQRRPAPAVVVSSMTVAAASGGASLKLESPVQARDKAGTEYARSQSRRPLASNSTPQPSFADCGQVWPQSVPHRAEPQSTRAAPARPAGRVPGRAGRGRGHDPVGRAALSHPLEVVCGSDSPKPKREGVPKVTI